MPDENVPAAPALYLELLKKTLTRALFEEADDIIGVSTVNRSALRWRLVNAAGRVARRMGLEVVRKRPYRPEERSVGLDRPARAETMVGLRRLDHLQRCIETVLRERVEGDLIETGVWRGGTTIFMRAVLKAYGVTDRRVFVADSFRGLPPPNVTRYPADAGDTHFTQSDLRVSVEDVRENFRRYGLLDEQVQFLEGWFEETLPRAPIRRLAILRLDGDMYASTIQALDALYPRLSTGGFCIVDDYGAVPACRQAVGDYRSAHGIHAPIERIDWTGICWRA